MVVGIFTYIHIIVRNQQLRQWIHFLTKSSLGGGIENPSHQVLLKTCKTPYGNILTKIYPLNHIEPLYTRYIPIHCINPTCSCFKHQVSHIFSYVSHMCLIFSHAFPTRKPRLPQGSPSDHQAITPGAHTQMSQDICFLCAEGQPEAWSQLTKLWGLHLWLNG